MRRATSAASAIISWRQVGVGRLSCLIGLTSGDHQPAHREEGKGLSSPQNPQAGSADATVGGERHAEKAYEALTIRNPGSLAELTQCGTAGKLDGHGYAGAIGRLGVTMGSV